MKLVLPLHLNLHDSFRLGGAGPARMTSHSHVLFDGRNVGDPQLSNGERGHRLADQVVILWNWYARRTPPQWQPRVAALGDAWLATATATAVIVDQRIATPPRRVLTMPLSALISGSAWTNESRHRGRATQEEIDAVFQRDDHQHLRIDLDPGQMFTVEIASNPAAWAALDAEITTPVTFRFHAEGVIPQDSD